MTPGSAARADERPSPITVAAVAVVAYALCDMVHEVLGHGLAAYASPHVAALILSTVALTTSQSSRLVASAGTLANLIVGVAALALSRRPWRSLSVRYFLWLLGSLDLFNGTGYLLYSGLLGSGDWGVVIAGASPSWLWRGGMALVGAVTYILSMAASAAALRRFVSDGSVRHADVSLLSRLPYGVGGALFVLGSIPNPVGPSLILTSGATSGFGAMAGLLGVPRLVRASGAPPESRASGLRFSRAWAAAAVLVAGVFVLVIGPGIRL
jgi:hypothetical protein